MSSSPGRRIRSNVRPSPKLLRCHSLEADPDSDINAELDELDREEFYRLKKVCIAVVGAKWTYANPA